MSDMREEQHKDEVISRAVKELKDEGEVRTGQLPGVTTYLSIREGMLFFRESLVIPKRCQAGAEWRVTPKRYVGPVLCANGTNRQTYPGNHWSNLT